MLLGSLVNTKDNPESQTLRNQIVGAHVRAIIMSSSADGLSQREHGVTRPVLECVKLPHSLAHLSEPSSAAAVLRGVPPPPSRAPDQAPPPHLLARLPGIPPAMILPWNCCSSITSLGL